MLFLKDYKKNYYHRLLFTSLLLLGLTILPLVLSPSFFIAGVNHILDTFQRALSPLNGEKLAEVIFLSLFVYYPAWVVLVTAGFGIIRHLRRLKRLKKNLQNLNLEILNNAYNKGQKVSNLTITPAYLFSTDSWQPGLWEKDTINRITYDKDNIHLLLKGQSTPLHIPMKKGTAPQAMAIFSAPESHWKDKIPQEVFNQDFANIIEQFFHYFSKDDK